MSLAAKAQKKEEDGEMRFPCFVYFFVYVGAIAAIAGATAAAIADMLIQANAF